MELSLLSEASREAPSHLDEQCRTCRRWQRRWWAARSLCLGRACRKRDQVEVMHYGKGKRWKAQGKVEGKDRRGCVPSLSIFIGTSFCDCSRSRYNLLFASFSTSLFILHIFHHGQPSQPHFIGSSNLVASSGLLPATYLDSIKQVSHRISDCIIQNISRCSSRCNKYGNTCVDRISSPQS